MIVTTMVMSPPAITPHIVASDSRNSATMNSTCHLQFEARGQRPNLRRRYMNCWRNRLQTIRREVVPAKAGQGAGRRRRMASR
jgi:hypothetical protein